MEMSDKTIGIFVSSTFKDMAGERDHLITLVYPKLEERLARLGLLFRDVDLRWGVPKMDGNSESVNSWRYCRSQIDRTVPFFIAIIGQRYGFVPDDLTNDDELGGAGLSITEMEIGHAIATAPRARRHMFFYVRETRVPEDLDDRHYRTYVDAETSVSSLIDRLPQEQTRRYACEWNEGAFADFEAFGQLVFDDLWSAVLRDERYVPFCAWERALPRSDVMKYYRSRLSIPESISNCIVEEVSRIASSGSRTSLDLCTYIEEHRRWLEGRRDILARLEEFIGRDQREHGSVRILYGNPGIGKSAIAAAFSERCRASGYLTFSFFVGATEYSSGSRVLVVELLKFLESSELGHFGIIDDTTTWDLYIMLERFLASYRGAQRVVIILDGLDAIPDTGDFRWLPNVLGPSIRMLLTCADNPPGGPSETMDLFWERYSHAAGVEVKGLGKGDISNIVQKYFLDYGKDCQSLASDISRFQVTSNPLYLLLVLNELRLRGLEMSEQAPMVVKKIGESCQNPLQLFERMLDRLKPLGEFAVQRWCAYVAIAREGLSKEDLGQLLARDLGPDGEKIALRITRTLRPYISIRENRILFRHDTLRSAVFHKYGTPTRSHHNLSEYFFKVLHSSREDQAKKWFHAANELTYHLYAGGGRYEDFNRLLTDATFYSRARDLLGRHRTLSVLGWAVKAAIRSEDAVLGVSTLGAWGIVTHHFRAKYDVLVQNLLESGHFDEALSVAEVGSSPVEIDCTLLTLAHLVLDKHHVSFSLKVVQTILVKGLYPCRESLRLRVTLIERLLSKGSDDGLELLFSPDSKYTTMCIFAFLLGTRHLKQSVSMLRRLARRISDNYWRGICQTMLACREVTRDLVDPALGADLKRTLRAWMPDDERDGLWQFAARCYPWLAPIGIVPSDVVPPDLDEHQTWDMTPDKRPPRYRATAAPTTMGRFEYLQHGPHTAALTPSTEIGLEIGISIVSSNYLHPKYLNASATQFDERTGTRSSASDVSDAQLRLDLARIGALSDEDANLALLSALGTLPDTEILHALNRFADHLSDTQWHGFFQRLRHILPSKEAPKYLEEFSKRLQHHGKPLPIFVKISFVDVLCHFRLEKEAFSWLRHILGNIGHAVTLSVNRPASHFASSSYINLHGQLPISPKPLTVEVLRDNVFSENGQGLGKLSKLAKCLEREFGFGSVPPGYINDRIGAAWTDRYVSTIRDTALGLDTLERFLSIDVIPDDRERRQSWFFWLFAIAEDPDNDQLERWIGDVGEVGSARLPHEGELFNFLLEMMGKDRHIVREDHSSWIVTHQDFCDLLKALQRDDKLKNKVSSNELFDVALRRFDAPSEQARCVAQIGQMSASKGDLEIANAFVDTARALASELGPLSELLRDAGDAVHCNNEDFLDRCWDSATFEDVFEQLVILRERSGDLPGLLSLMRYLEKSPDLWRPLIYSFCRRLTDTTSKRQAELSLREQGKIVRDLWMKQENRHETK